MSAFTHCSETVTSSLKTLIIWNQGHLVFSPRRPSRHWQWPHSSLTFTSNIINSCPCLYAILVIPLGRSSLLKEPFVLLCSIREHPGCQSGGHIWLTAPAGNSAGTEHSPLCFGKHRRQLRSHSDTVLLLDSSEMGVGVCFIQQTLVQSVLEFFKSIHIGWCNGHSWHFNSKYCFYKAKLPQRYWMLCLV